MKIALCISGQPRGIPFSCDMLKKALIEPNGITDIFIHTWYDPSCDNKPFDSAQPAQNNRVGIWQPQSDKIILETLNPTLLECESPKDFTEEGYDKLPGPDSAVQPKIASIFYGFWKANQLKCKYENENGFKYDIVIRTRLDLLYRQIVKIESLITPEESIEEHIYTPYMYQHHRQGDVYYTAKGIQYSSMSDTFAFSSSENMDKFCSVYPNFIELHEILYPYVYGESYLGYQVRHAHGIKIACADIQYELMHRVIDMNQDLTNIKFTIQ